MTGASVRIRSWVDSRHSRVFGAVLVVVAGSAVAANAMLNDSGPGANTQPAAAGSGAGGAIPQVLPPGPASTSRTTGSANSAHGGSAAGAPGEVSTAARSVSYLGHRFTVPAGWHLVDLNADSTRCVRFDLHAVYFGSPSAEQRCASQTDGTVQGAMLVEPSPAATTARATDDALNQRITATLRGVEITASYGTDRSSVVSLLAGAGVPTPTEAPASESTTQVSNRIAANLSSIHSSVTPQTVGAMTQVYSGLGFDACTAPSTTQMTAWTGSPYGAIGVYIGGAERACAQPNLTSSWVTTEANAGWRLMPLYVGPQVSNGTVTDAAAQGKASADDAATQASSLGIGSGALLYYDMEGGSYTAAQNTTAQAFVTAWTTELHALHYHAAVYGNESGAVGAMVSAWGTTAEPDVLDVANWNNNADDDPGADPSGYWHGHRVHQFQGDTNATYGGVTINIDQDYFSLAAPCGPALSSGTAVQPRYMTSCAASPAPEPSASQ